LHTGSSQSEPPEVRRLYALPLASDLDYQDLDVQLGKTGGTLTWEPPSDVAEITSYSVYLTDEAGSASGRVSIGSRPVGSNSIVLPTGTSLGASLTHLFVNSVSAQGERPDGPGYEICDVSFDDTIFVENAVATSKAWGISELSFYSDPTCTGSAMRFAQVGITDYAGIYTPSRALDGMPGTAWMSSCSTCTATQASVGVVGVCRPEEVRCVRMVQCTEGLGSYGCPTTAHRAASVTLKVKGESTFTWKMMQGQRSNTQLKLEEEILAVPSRRRQALMSAFVDMSGEVRTEYTTNPAFTSR